MGNEQGKKGKKGPAVHVPTPSEIKTFIMIAQNKLSLFRNKKIDAIRKKKHEIAKSLRENNLDVAKAKMDSLIREEDYITSYDILGPLLEILKERVTYIVTKTSEAGFILSFSIKFTFTNLSALLSAFDI